MIWRAPVLPLTLFADVLSEADADAIHAYIIDEARKQVAGR